MTKHPLTPINPTASSTSTGRDRRPSSAIYIGNGSGIGFHSSSSTSSISSPLPPLPLTSPLTPGPLSSVSPPFSTSTPPSHTQPPSQLPSPPSTTAGSTGSAGDGDGDGDRGSTSATKRMGASHQRVGSSSSLEANRLGNRLSASVGLSRDRVWEDDHGLNAELDEEQLLEEELEGDHTARRRIRNLGRGESGRKATISLDHESNTLSKPLSGSETERERDQEFRSARIQIRARTPERHARSSSDSNTNVSVEYDNDATPPASGRRTVRIGEDSQHKPMSKTFSVIGTGRRTRTVSLLEGDRDVQISSPTSASASPAPTPGPGPSTLTNRRARAPLPQEFRSDRMSLLNGLDSRSTDDLQLDTTSMPLSPRRSRDSKASTLRESRKNKRTFRLSLGDGRGSEHDFQGVDDTQSTSSTTYGGRRQTVRQTGSAESALARERAGEGSLRGFVASERSVVGESLRAAGLVRRSTVAGVGDQARKQSQSQNQNLGHDSLDGSPAFKTSPSRRRDREIPASRYSTVRLDVDSPQSSHNHVRAATSMAVYRDRDRREDSETLSVATSRRTLRSSLGGDRDRDRERPPSTLRFTPLSDPRLSDREARGSSPLVQSQQQQQQPPSSSSASAGTDHTRLLLDALQIFESHLSKPFPPSSSSSTLSSTFPDLEAHATTLVQSAHTLNELLRTLTSRALESQIEAEIGDAPAQIDAGEIWRIVGAEYREGLRVSDDLVRVVTALLIAFGRVLRDVAKRTGNATTIASTGINAERDRERGAESPDTGGGSVLSGGTGASSGQRSSRSRQSLDSSLRFRPIRRSTGMEGSPLPTHPSGEGRRSAELVSPSLSLGGRRSAELGLSAARLREKENRERITGRRSMDGVGGYVSHTHSSSAETLKHDRVFLEIPRPSTSLSFIRRDRERISRDDGEGNEEEGDETARDVPRERERRTTIDRLSLRRTVMPRLRDGIPADFRFGSGNASSSQVELSEGSNQTPAHAPVFSQTQLRLLTQVQAQDSPTPVPRASPITLNPRRQLAVPPPLPSLPSESLFQDNNDGASNNHNDNNNLSFPSSTSASSLPSASSSLIRSNSASGAGASSNPGIGSIRRRPKFSNTSITTVRGSISSLRPATAPILSPSTSAPTTAVSNDEVEIKGGRNAGTNIASSGGSMRVRSGTLELRNLQERDRVTRERLGHGRTDDKNTVVEPRERDTQRSVDTLRKRAFSSASASQSGSGEDSNLRTSGTSTVASSSASTLSRTRTLRSRPRMSLDSVEFDGNDVGPGANRGI